MGELYLNGQFVPPEQAVVPVMDRGFLFGDGVYEVIPAYGGTPRRVDAHLDRLDASLRGLGLEAPMSREGWRDVFRRLLAADPDADQAIYLQVTRGVAPVRDHRFPERPRPTVLAMAKPLALRGPAVAELGVAAVVRDDIRWSRCDIKSIALLAAVLLRQDAHECAAEEALLVRDGLVVEGSTSNLFVVSDGKVLTPPTGPYLLAGVTRALVLELLRGAGIAAEERNISASMLPHCNEIWITSSTREVMPVGRLDGAAVGTGLPGPVWRQVDRLYQDFKASLRSQRV
jgi:D-alanine transaminase